MSAKKSGISKTVLVVRFSGKSAFIGFQSLSQKGNHSRLQPRMHFNTAFRKYCEVVLVMACRKDVGDLASRICESAMRLSADFQVFPVLPDWVSVCLLVCLDFELFRSSSLYLHAFESSNPLNSCRIFESSKLDWFRVRAYARHIRFLSRPDW